MVLQLLHLASMNIIRHEGSATTAARGSMGELTDEQSIECITQGTS